MGKVKNPFKKNSNYHFRDFQEIAVYFQSQYPKYEPTCNIQHLLNAGISKMSGKGLF